MGEIRIDVQTGQWRLIAPQRAARPVDPPDTAAAHLADGPAGADLVDRPAAGHTVDPAGPVAGCPFCPGNEAMTPPELLRVPSRGAGAWRIRGFANKFPLTVPRRPGDGSELTGHHEVLVESPRHDRALRDADPDEAAEILSAARERCRVLAAQGAEAVIVFANHGAAAGTSLAHPHTQIVALDQTPPDLLARWRRARDHHQRTGHRLLDDLAAAAREAGRRVVADADGVLVVVPYAAAGPYEMLLLPDHAPADLAGTGDDVLVAVARMLPPVLAALADALGDPSYNLVVHAGPGEAGPWLRWHIGVYPRVTTPGGLELATGLSVNPSSPEDTASTLRRLVATHR